MQNRDLLKNRQRMIPVTCMRDKRNQRATWQHMNVMFLLPNGYLYFVFLLTITIYTLPLLLFPNLFRPGFPPFIFLAEKPFKSPLDTASPLFENRFFPPKPNFSSFLWRLVGLALAEAWLSRKGLEDLSGLEASSRATSKRSSSLAGPTVSAFLRSRGVR